MTWFKIDDGFSTHAKVDALEADQPLAVACWTLCGSACMRDLTGGVVTRAAIRRVLALWSDRDRQRAAAALVRVGLWLDHPEGWQFHDWKEYQPSREKVLGERERKAQNKRDSRSNGKGSHQHVTAPVTAPVTGDSSAPSRECHHGPDPTRPDLAAKAAGEPSSSPANGDAADEGESPFGRRLRLTVTTWRKRYLAALGMDAAGNLDTEMREVVRVIGSAVGDDDGAYVAALGSALDGYFADDYLRRNPRTASARNLVSRLNALMLATRAAAISGDPPDYDPAIHGQPKTPANFDRWNAYLRKLAS
jgi:hypothetical protein